MDNLIGEICLIEYFDASSSDEEDLFNADSPTPPIVKTVGRIERVSDLFVDIAFLFNNSGQSPVVGLLLPINAIIKIISLNNKKEEITFNESTSNLGVKINQNVEVVWGDITKYQNNRLNNYSKIITNGKLEAELNNFIFIKNPVSKNTDNQEPHNSNGCKYLIIPTQLIEKIS